MVDQKKLELFKDIKQLVDNVSEVYKNTDGIFAKLMVIIIAFFAVLVCYVLWTISIALQWVMYITGAMTGLYIAIFVVCPWLGIDVLAMLQSVIMLF